MRRKRGGGVSFAFPAVDVIVTTESLRIREASLANVAVVSPAVISRAGAGARAGINLFVTVVHLSSSFVGLSLSIQCFKLRLRLSLKHTLAYI